MTVYRFRRGSRLSGDPEATAAELERIRIEQGALRPESIVEEAADDDSPLHPHFEWDDGAAGHAYRLIQARTLVRAIVRVEDRQEVAVYAHVSMEPVGEGEYLPLHVIAREPDRYAVALSEAQRDLDAARRRVGELLAVAKSGKASKGDVARIALAVQAIETARDAIHAVH